MTRCAPIAMLALATAAVLPSVAKADRPFPATALRGELRIEQPPDVRLNGRPARLAPGARIRGADNLLQLSGGLVGQTMTVHYTTDVYGLLMDVWVLTADEKKVNPWPRTPTEAAAWRFDPGAQRWAKP